MTNDSSRKRTIADSFGDAADAYLDSRVHNGGTELQRIASWCADATCALDVATGAGHTAGALSRAGVPCVVAVDAAPEMATTAATTFDGVDTVVGDAERLPFGADQFDAVTCRIAAHHFPDPEAFVAETARVLRSGGTFVLADNVAPEDDALDAFINRVESIRDPTHVRSYRTFAWRTWLERAGITVEEETHFRTTLDFEDWVETQSLPPAERDSVEAVLRTASPAARACFEITTANGSVESFANLKVLLRGRLTDSGEPSAT